MLSKNSKYDMDNALNEIELKKLMMDVKVETQVVLQLLVSKGVVTRKEVVDMRERVKSSPAYKAVYDYLNTAADTANYYKQNPDQHLKNLFNAKLNGMDD